MYKSRRQNNPGPKLLPGYKDKALLGHARKPRCENRREHAECACREDHEQQAYAQRFVVRAVLPRTRRSRRRVFCPADAVPRRVDSVRLRDKAADECGGGVCNVLYTCMEVAVSAF